MYLLPASWSAAARYSGRFDPWPSVDALGGAESFSRARPDDLMAAGVPVAVASRALSDGPLQVSVPFVVAGAPEYPKALRGVPFAPPVLFYQGDLSVLQRPMVAIVGTRRCTPYGRRTAWSLARGVAMGGGVVVSGLAIGIDMAAHEGAMEKGATVAVLGHGIQAGWRPGARRLGEDICRKGGVVLSEFLPEWPAGRFTFTQRNRVIAGLGRATVVVEAGHRSGALSTARQALAIHREVLSVPGPITGGASEGCLDLIERGATVVRGLSTVLEAAGLTKGGGPGDAGLVPGTLGVVRDLLLMGATLDQLVASSGLPVAAALSALAELELAGVVRREAGQRFVMTRAG